MLKLHNDEETLKIVPNIKCCTHVYQNNQQNSLESFVSIMYSPSTSHYLTMYFLSLYGWNIADTA